MRVFSEFTDEDYLDTLWYLKYSLHTSLDKPIEAVEGHIKERVEEHGGKKILVLEVNEKSL